MRYWGKVGAYWGGFWGLLFGSAVFAIPGIGTVLMGGPIVGALEGAAMGGGLSALGGGLAGLGIPKDSVVQYELATKTDKYLVVVHDTAAQVSKAREIRGNTLPVYSDLRPAGVELEAAR